MLRDVEPDPYKRKELAIEILKELEKEKGHDAEAIGRAIVDEGKAGIIKRAVKKSRKKKQKESEEGEKEEARAVA